MEAVRKTFLHLAELVVVVLIAWLIVTIFKVEAEVTEWVILAVLAALAKFVRASGNDYVNGK